jgi:hypothetical protein
VRSRDIAGKTVACIEQQRFWNTHIGAWSVGIDRIVFTDGSSVRFCALELECDLYVHATAEPNTEERER